MPNQSGTPQEDSMKIELEEMTKVEDLNEGVAIPKCEDSNPSEFGV